MPDSDDWRVLINQELGSRPAPVTAVTYLDDKKSSYSRAFKVSVNGRDYWVKAIRKNKDIGRALCVEQIASCLGRKLVEAVPPISLVELSEEFVESEPELAEVKPGVAHGTRDLGECSPKRTDVAYVDVADNRKRFAALAVFYGWFHGYDEQVLYQTQSPELVHSVDHGHFLPPANGNKDDWSIDSLKEAPDPEPYPKFVSGASLTKAELRPVYRSLADIKNDDIAEAVAQPPDEWRIDIDERVAIAEYLAERRNILVASVLEEKTNG